MIVGIAILLRLSTGLLAGWGTVIFRKLIMGLYAPTA